MSNKNKIENSVADLIKPKKKYLYKCNCSYCKGKEVNLRTQERHMKNKSLWESKVARKHQENAIEARKKKKYSIPSNASNVPKTNLPKKRKIDSDHDSLSHTSRNLDSPSIDALYSSRSKSSRFHAPIENEDNNDNYYPDNDPDDSNHDDDNYRFVDNFDDDNSLEEEEGGNIDQEEGFFATPKIDNDELLFEMKSLNDSIDSEIVIWVFKFQQIFKIPDKALEALIKFLYTILVRLNKQQFDEFSNSLYKAKKLLNLFEPKLQLAVCTKCHKLHNAANIIDYKEEGKVVETKCLHEEYSNNPIPSQRNQCGNPLSIIKRNKSKTVAIPYASP